MKNLRASVVALLAAVISGCVLAPGQHMEAAQILRSGTYENSRYGLVPITGKEIAMEQASAVAPTIPQELLDFKPEPYRIAVGDSLYITVWDHPELTSPAGPQQQPSANGRLVRADGTLYYPYAGTIQAAGKTIDELRVELSNKLTKFVPQPQVDVNVINYGVQRVVLRGAFLKTDPQPITVAPMTLAQSIGVATVNTLQADLSNLTLIRDGHTYHLDLDALSRTPHGLDDIWLKSGDQIFLPYNDKREAYLMGEVVRPIAIPFGTTTLSLTQVLGRGGGLNQVTSKGRAVYVIRGVADMEKEPATIYQLDADSPAAFALASEFPVHPGDVVFVGASDITRWSRFLAQLVPLGNLVEDAAVSKTDINP
jgi:polysaccharide export outer membrane protein